MGEGGIFVANLSNVAPECRDTLGKFLLTFFHLTALGRSDLPPERRRPYHIYADEAHRFVGAAMEDLIAETRKYGVSLTLAHQHLKQFDQKALSTLGIMGSVIAFNVHHGDAEHMARVLGDQVLAQDLKALEVGEAIARIGTQVVRLKTRPPSETTDPSRRERLVRRSNERYCKRVPDIERELADRAVGSRPARRPAMGNGAEAAEVFSYVEL
jgi:hypothetical protein